MKHKITILFLLFVTLTFAQVEEFNNAINKIQPELKTVENSKKTFEQSIEVTEPGVITLLSNIIDSKGKTISNKYIINLGDIDKNTLRHFTNKDIIQVQLVVEKNQKLIKHVYNEEKISYINKVVLQTENVENARLLVDLFKEALPYSKSITEKRLALNGYNDHLNWLSKNIGNVNLIKSSVSQEVSLIDGKIGNIKLDKIVNNGSKSKTEAYELNLATLNENSVIFKITGNLFNVEVQTKRKLNTIKYSKEFEQQNYIYKLNISCNSVENARDLQKVLKEAIILSREKFNTTIPKITDFKTGIDALNKLANTITIGDETYNQSFSDSQLNELIKKISDPKSTKELVYNFNFADLNKNAIDFSVKGKKIMVNFSTQSSHKYLKYTKDKELQNYTNKAFVLVSTVDDAIFAKNIIKDLTLIAVNNIKPLSFSSFNNDFKQLAANISSVDVASKTYEQSIEITDVAENNSVKFVSTLVSEKSSKEYIYEFNISDLNLDNVNLVTKGKTVFVEINTNYGEKIIKAYENGVIKNYKNKLPIYANSVENARVIKDLIKLLIKNIN